MVLIFLKFIQIPLIPTMCFKKNIFFLWNAHFFTLIFKFLDTNLNIIYLICFLYWSNLSLVNIKMLFKYATTYSSIISCNVSLMNS